MNFLPSPDPDRLPLRPEPPAWLWALCASAAVLVLATRWPWTEVAFQRLFSAATGPPGWQSTAGFTCACAGAFAVILALVETQSKASKQAARPGSLMIVAIAALMLAFDVIRGPGMLRGVSAAWTFWFWLACAAVPVLLTVVVVRWRKTEKPARPTGL
ncbi:MAG: hypothetical protein NXI31_03180 [bacterium]|nr:hypothetical protein [bacterium]